MPTLQWEDNHYAHPDVELGTQRQHSLKSYFTAPWVPDESRPYLGLVVVLHGCGQSENDSYQQKLRDYIATTYGVLCVNVGFHGSGLHPIDYIEQCALRKKEYQIILEKLGPAITDQITDSAYEVEGHPDWIKFRSRQLSLVLEAATNFEEMEKTPYVSYLKVIADNQEYQNFGVLQSLDILTVLNDTIRRYHFEKNNVIALGSSHGGYLGHLCSKFAPNTFRAVIEGSSYPYTPLYMIANRPFTGMNYYFAYRRDLSTLDGRVLYETGDPVLFDSRWELADTGHPNFFGLAPMQIRNLNFSAHWDELSKHRLRPCQYRMIHSSQDQVFQPLEDRRNQAQRLIENGMDVYYKEMSEADIDGRLVKHLGHGMGCSMRALFDRFYPTIKPTYSLPDSELGTVVSFQCGDRIYEFDHGRRPILKII